MDARRHILMAITLAAAALLGGCRAPGESQTFAFDAAEYADAFDATREALIATQFQIDRVDASNGVITSKPKSTAGLATPWDPEQSSLQDEWSDFTNQHRRTVQVTFVAASEFENSPSDVSSPSAPPADLRDREGRMVGRVDVFVERLTRPGWRPETEAVRLTTYARDGSGDPSANTQWVPIRRDDELAARLTAKIERELKKATGQSEPVVSPNS